MALLVVGSAVALAGCAGPAPPPGKGSVPVGVISVRAADTACTISTAQAPAGKLTFAVTNVGGAVAGFSLYGADDRIVGGVENIDPGVTRLLTVEVTTGGVYTTVCRAGTVGDGIRAPFTVTDAAARSVGVDADLAAATTAYQRYVSSQVAGLVPTTRDFAGAVEAGDVDRAKALYPAARAYYERIEPLAESFLTLDARLDGREDDGRDPGVAWTGFHRLEKDLWIDGLQADSAQVADQLVSDVGELRTRAATLQVDPTRMANGAKELLDETATRKINGEEDRYSHTDLWDLKANVEGAEAVIAALRAVIDRKDPTLGPLLDERFAAIDRLLAGLQVGDGYRSYAELTQDEIKKMTDAVDALSEPLSQVAAVVTS